MRCSVWVVCLVGLLAWGCSEEEEGGGSADTSSSGTDTTTTPDGTEGDSADTDTDTDTAGDGTTASDTQDSADEVEPPVILCDDSCQFSKNSICDDDGPGATSDICALGTDCADCGPRDPDATCGDGQKSPAEACDDGNTTPDDYCSPDCRTITGSCGDGTKQPIEQCEDGNTTNNDGCSQDCIFEVPCSLPDACPDPGASVCDPETLNCAPIQCDASTGVGCAPGEVCQGQPLVIDEQLLGLVGACYRSCTPGVPGACEEGMTCVVRPYQPDDEGVCVRAGDAAVGEACTAPPDHITSTGCVVGALCDPPVQFPNEGVCKPQCALFGAPTGCEGALLCTASHACIDESGDAVTVGFGQFCGIAAANHTACAPNSTAFLGLCIGANPTCRKVCEMGNLGARGCDDGDVCTRVKRGAGLGVCMKEPACGDGIQHPTEPCDSDTACTNCQPDYAALCAGALELIPGIIEGTTNGGSSAFGHNSCAIGPAPEALYTFTAPSDGVLSLRGGSAENRDIALYVLEGCGGDAPVACADDFAGSAPEGLTLEVVAGQTYTIVVDGVLGDRGAFVIEALFE